MPFESQGQHRFWLCILLLSWGMQAIVTQSLLLREALVLMFGSEFAWGVVLFAWLFGVAVGGVLGGWMAQRVPRPDVALVVVLTALSAAACLELWVFRGARAWLGIPAGELLPLPKTALAAVLFVSPASALVGMAFPLACCVTNMASAPSGGRGVSDVAYQPVAVRGLFSLGNVYALESAGSLIGGAVFSFWAVEHLSPIQTALGCGAIVTVSSAGFLTVSCRRLRPTGQLDTQGARGIPTYVGATFGLRFGAITLAALAVAALGTSIFAGDALNRRLVNRRWHNVAPGYELCAEAESKYQNLAVGRRAEQFTLYSDGQVTADFPDPYTFVPLAHFWLCQHPRPSNVLVIGGGAEGLLAEILRHGVDHVDYVEPDPRQIELIEPFITDDDRQALSDPRTTVHHVDARHFVKTVGRRRSPAGDTASSTYRFDLVIARLPEPMSALRARLYTEEFYGELRGAMTPRSVLCMTAAATPGQLSAASAEYLASIRATLRRHFPYVTIGWGNPAQVLAATEPGLISTDPAELAKRYTDRNVQSGLFDPAWFVGATDWLEPRKLEQREAQLDAVPNVQTGTDLHPVAYMQRLVLWERMTGGQSRGTALEQWYVIQRLRAVDWGELIAALLGVGGITLLAYYLRARARGTALEQWLSPGAITLSVGTTGFVTMALSIIWLFAFQNLYGYVYQRIGWIVALFMAGLVVGCAAAGWKSNRLSPFPIPHSTFPIPHLTPPVAPLLRCLVLVDVLMALLALVVPFILPVLGSLQSSPLTFTVVEVCISALVLVTGLLGGAAFALAGALQLGSTGRPGAAAGSIVGADHAGACLGALLCGILLVPVFGTAATAFLLAGIKLSSAALLVVGLRLSRAV